MARAWRGWAGVMAVTLAVLTLGGCELLYFAGMKNKKPAAFTFPKGHKVLVLVDLGNGVSAPPDFTTTFADNIGRALWQSRAIDTPLMPQDRLVALRQNPDAFGSMKLGDIAQAVHADNLLYIRVTQLVTNLTADGTVAEGYAEVRIKVVDQDGTRIWPGDATGEPLSARLNLALLSDRGVPDIIKQLAEQLTTQIDAEFHETIDDGRHVGQ